MATSTRPSGAIYNFLDRAYNITGASIPTSNYLAAFYGYGVQYQGTIYDGPVNLTTGKFDDIIDGRGKKNWGLYLMGNINTGDGNDKIYGTGTQLGVFLEYGYIYTGSGDDYVYGSTTQFTGIGIEAAFYFKDSSGLSTGSGNDRVIGAAAGNGRAFWGGFVDTGEGNDVVDALLGGINGTRILLGDGDDTFVGYGSGFVDGGAGLDTAQLANGKFNVSINIGNYKKLVNTETKEILELLNVENLIIDRTATLTYNYDPVQISAAPLKARINEGETLEILVGTSGLPAGTGLFWRLTGKGIDQKDFRDSIEGYTLISSDGTFKVINSALSDIITEGDEEVSLQIFADKDYTRQIGASSKITIADTSRAPIYNITTSKNQYNEGESLEFSVTTRDVATGTSVFWTLEGAGIDAADFGGVARNAPGGALSEQQFLSGVGVVSANGIFKVNRTIVNDYTTEGNENLKFRLFTDSSKKTILGESSPVTIIDTSLSPSATATVSAKSISEGSTLTTNVSISNLASGSTVYYDIVGSGITSSDFSAGALSGQAIVDANKSFRLSHTLRNDLLTEGTETFEIRFFADQARSKQFGSTGSIEIIDSSKGYTINSLFAPGYANAAIPNNLMPNKSNILFSKRENSRSYQNELLSRSLLVGGEFVELRYENSALVAQVVSQSGQLIGNKIYVTGTSEQTGLVNSWTMANAYANVSVETFSDNTFRVTWGYLNINTSQPTGSPYSRDFRVSNENTKSTNFMSQNEFNKILTNDVVSQVGNSANNWIVGNDKDNVLVGGGGKDLLTGAGGSDIFVYSKLSDSLLGNFDSITDLNTEIDKIYGPNPIASVNIKNAGRVTALTSQEIGKALSAYNFGANTAATFTNGIGSSERTFLAINDSIAGFDSSKDAIIEITGYSGSLGKLSII